MGGHWLVPSRAPRSCPRVTETKSPLRRLRGDIIRPDTSKKYFRTQAIKSSHSLSPVLGEELANECDRTIGF